MQPRPSLRHLVACWSRRRYSSQWQQPASTRAPYIAVGICCLGFGYNYWADEQVKRNRDYRHRNFIDRNFVLTQQNVDQGRWWTLVTHTGMHFHPLHLLANMVCLISFGPSIGSILGVQRFIILWSGSGIVGGQAALASERWKERENAQKAPVKTNPVTGGSVISEGPRHRSSVVTRNVGSSTSILGFFTVLACIRPSAAVMIFPIPKAIPISWAALGFASLSGLALSQDWLPAIGHAGHLGGMAFGGLYYLIALRRKMRFPRL